MAADNRTLSADTIRSALRRLGALASAANEKVRLVAVGGAVMVLKYQQRESTRDVDAIFILPRPTAPIRKWAAAVAREQDLPEDWLNDGAKGFVGESPPEGEVLFSDVGITVMTVPPEVMLATKLAAFRDAVDRSDARRILREMRGAKDVIWPRVEPHVQPPAQLTKAWYAFEELWAELHDDD